MGRKKVKKPNREVTNEIPPGVDKQDVDRYASFFDDKHVTVMAYSSYFWKPYSQHMKDLIQRAVRASKAKIVDFC